MKRIIVGITGASAVIYGVRLLEILTQFDGYEIHLTISDSGARALWEELQIRVDLDDFHLESLIGHPSDRVDLSPSVRHRSVNCQRLLPHPGYDRCAVQHGDYRLDSGRHFSKPHSARRRCLYQGTAQTGPCAPRNAAQSYPSRKYAQAIPTWCGGTACDAGLLPLPQDG